MEWCKYASSKGGKLEMVRTRRSGLAVDGHEDSVIVVVLLVELYDILPLCRRLHIPCFRSKYQSWIYQKTWLQTQLICIKCGFHPLFHPPATEIALGTQQPFNRWSESSTQNKGLPVFVVSTLNDLSAQIYELFLNVMHYLAYLQI